MCGCGGSTETTTESTETADSETAAVTTVTEGKFIWATNAEFEPYEYREGDEIVGIDAEIAAYIAEQLGLEVQCEDMAFDSVIAAVTTGKVDAGIAGMTITEDRLENVNFSTPYIDAGQVVIVRFDSPIKTLDDLAGKTIAVQSGTTGDTYVTENVEGAVVDRYSKGAEAVQAVLQNKADAVVIDNEPAKAYLEKDEDNDLVLLDEALTVEEYAIAVSKDNEALLTEINAILAEMEENGKMEEIKTKYLGTVEEVTEETTEAGEDAEVVEEVTEETTAA